MVLVHLAVWVAILVQVVWVPLEVYVVLDRFVHSSVSNLLPLVILLHCLIENQTKWSQ